MERIKLIKSTRLDKPAQLWIAAYARKHFFRMPSYYELDDLIQDGYWLWYQLLARPRYQGLTDKPQVMNLFKLAFASWVADLSKERQCKSKSRGEAWDVHHFAQQCYIDPADLENMGDPETSTFRVMVSTAPEAVKKAISTSLQADDNLVVFQKDGTRELSAARKERLNLINEYFETNYLTV